MLYSQLSYYYKISSICIFWKYFFAVRIQDINVLQHFVLMENDKMLPNKEKQNIPKIVYFVSFCELLLEQQQSAPGMGPEAGNESAFFDFLF